MGKQLLDPSNEPTKAAFATAGQAMNDWWQNTASRRMAIIGIGVGLVLVVGLIIAMATANGASSAKSGGSTTAAVATVQPPAHTEYNAAAPTAAQGSVVNVKLVAEEKLISIAPGVAYHAWTFNGTVPGPVIRVRQGQTINFTLVNSTGMAHSIDFHAAQTPWNVNYQAVAPGKTFSFSWRANYPGVFMYHCGTPPVIVHISNGMYGMIIVDPANGWPAAQEYAVVQSEFYTQKGADGTYWLDTGKMMRIQPDYVVFNGYANQYQATPITVKAGQTVRLFVLNAGPSKFSAFHVIGAIFSDVYIDGNPANHFVGDQTVSIPPSGGAVIELTFPEAGSYPFVTHAFADASSGAVGVIKAVP